MQGNSNAEQHRGHIFHMKSHAQITVLTLLRPDRFWRKWMVK
uniref:Uncharacterized protein n=1 Tax=Anguilla anguilla TaxID=7936 RepID=A0A0E9W9X8_ANGAN